MTGATGLELAAKLVVTIKIGGCDKEFEEEVEATVRNFAVVGGVVGLEFDPREVEDSLTEDTVEDGDGGGTGRDWIGSNVSTECTDSMSGEEGAEVAGARSEMM